MVIVPEDVAHHFNCDLDSAAKITRILVSSTDVSMIVPDIVDFTFCGVSYSLVRTIDEWVMIRAVSTRSSNLEDVL